MTWFFSFNSIYMATNTDENEQICQFQKAAFCHTSTRHHGQNDSFEFIVVRMCEC